MFLNHQAAWVFTNFNRITLLLSLKCSSRSHYTQGKTQTLCGGLAWTCAQPALTPLLPMSPPSQASCSLLFLRGAPSPQLWDGPFLPPQAVSSNVTSSESPPNLMWPAPNILLFYFLIRMKTNLICCLLTFPGLSQQDLKSHGLFTVGLPAHTTSPSHRSLQQMPIEIVDAWIDLSQIHY